MTVHNRSERDVRVSTSLRRQKRENSRSENGTVELTGEDWAAIRPWLDPCGWREIRPVPEMGGA